MRRALLACASLSIAAHALTFTLLPSPERAVLVRAKAGSSNTWQMRLAASTPPPTRPETAPVITSPEGSHDAPIVEPEPLQAEPELPAMDTMEQPKADTPEPAAPPDKGGAEGDQAGLTEYIPRPQLSLPPVPQRTAIIVPPSGNYPTDRIVGTLSLYIDETGTVHHILSSGAPMPPEFEEAAKQAFMPLTFRPGILNGIPVKSRIRIEVVFDNTPLPDAPTKPQGSSDRP